MWIAALAVGRPTSLGFPETGEGATAEPKLRGSLPSAGSQLFAGSGSCLSSAVVPDLQFDVTVTNRQNSWVGNFPSKAALGFATKRKSRRERWGTAGKATWERQGWSRR